MRALSVLLFRVRFARLQVKLPKHWEISIAPSLPTNRHCDTTPTRSSRSRRSRRSVEARRSSRRPQSTLGGLSGSRRRVEMYGVHLVSFLRARVISLGSEEALQAATEGIGADSSFGYAARTLLPHD
jgi:hypothetical protein